MQNCASALGLSSLVHYLFSDVEVYETQTLKVVAQLHNQLFQA
jgi:hypothetical protein